ncbi:type IV pilus modification protein PilV [Seongchinamella sediminis]|uniref:Type IV pilus modification protein PilV n=1 Tax=Seongchinamella sediminis TaxID=2283635 RepID=A0A3L7DV20_9GAMM|nr:type IV pilus modification protein PilV [Seongchinamella sediminis]RLQ21417.1 type IV pilus modification protein PilV [Seongchinamella sediminis]
MRALNAAGIGRQKPQTGVALIEVAIAILVIAVGAIGLASMQLSAKRAGFEAVQRTFASGVAMDILERMRLNPGVLDSYESTVGGATLSTPGSTCLGASCTEAQLVAADLWAWEQALDGAAETRGGASVGGLLNPTGCIDVDGRQVEVTIAWESYETLSDPDATNTCGQGNYGASDANRHLLVVNTYIVEL